jgi:hypothetical protein
MRPMSKTYDTWSVSSCGYIITIWRSAMGLRLSVHRTLDDELAVELDRTWAEPLGRHLGLQRRDGTPVVCGSGDTISVDDVVRYVRQLERSSAAMVLY